MKTAILGWGSLIWETGHDFEKWHDNWTLDGPILPIEFSRISCSRLGALTLVIDPIHGSKTTVAWCQSKRGTMKDAICDLRLREGTTNANIARLDVAISDATQEADDVLGAIRAWASTRALDAVIWTGLPSNFEEKRREPFSVESAIRYVHSMSTEGKKKAAEYIWHAPDFVGTPLREKLQALPWFSPSGG